MQLHRSLRLGDVVLFFLLACTNLQWVATAAAAGPSSLPVWLIGCAAMFVPISIAVMVLSSRYPDEGGMYVWSKRAFGPFAGFITGWTYWCSNLPYFPALLYFMAGNALFIGGASAAGLSASPAYYITVSLLGFAFATIVNVLGLDIGKWLNNVGALSRWLATLILIALGAFAVVKFGSATHINVATLRPSVQLKDLIFWSVIVFAWTGPEAVPFMAGEVKNPRRNIPLGLALAAPAIATIYVFGTAAVLTAVPAAHVSPLYGAMQSIDAVAGREGWSALSAVSGILITISCLGSVGVWLGAVSRIPFVAGIDRYLPDAFGRLHPRWGSPVVALLTQAGISAFFIVLSQGGTTVKGAYDVLVSSTVVITLVPFLFLFSAAIKLRVGALTAASSLIGLVTTAGGIILALFPAADEPNKALAVAKVIGLTVLMLGSGVLVYLIRSRRSSPSYSGERMT